MIFLDEPAQIAEAVVQIRRRVTLAAMMKAISANECYPVVTRHFGDFPAGILAFVAAARISQYPARSKYPCWA